MSYDYSGYGISEGEPSEEACFADAEAAFAYLVNVKKIPPSKIILSLGSGPTTHLAVKQSNVEQPVAGVILQSPVLSMFRVVFNFRYTFPGDLFCNIDIIDQVRSPVTIIHGTRDEVVPFWHGEGLFEMCPQDWRCKPLWVTDAGHNNIEAYLRCVQKKNNHSAVLAIHNSATNLDCFAILHSTFGDTFFQHLIEFVQVCHATATIRAAEAAEQKSMLSGKFV
ncbi:unnamed protein product [Phytophthora fragariaefolia]|uniref:Unnamed protein product n=1 Tax=Phytophthora fragariaefolia TaxID=1490495 RepID=A0A9W6TUM8_9STRA|nr:unnamed protein product [Phytophthora fragariaefolia]